MTIILQLSAIFSFGLVITGIVFVGILRAREHSLREQAVADEEETHHPATALRVVS